MTGYLKLRFLWRREMQSGDFLMCLGILGFSIVVGETMCFVGGKSFGRMKGVVNFVGEIICGRMEGVVNFEEEGLGIVR